MYNSPKSEWKKMTYLSLIFLSGHPPIYLASIIIWTYHFVLSEWKKAVLCVPISYISILYLPLQLGTIIWKNPSVFLSLVWVKEGCTGWRTYLLSIWLSTYLVYTFSARHHNLNISFCIKWVKEGCTMCTY